MAQLKWDEVGTRNFETGVDHGVLYLPDQHGNYVTGVAWSGLTSVSEAPSGAEPSAQYADNMKYLNLFSAEELGLTIECFTFPDEFQRFDGLGVPVAGVTVGQQSRPMFGFCYRTLVGNDVDGNDAGYKLHLVYGCQASPSEKAYATVNDSPEAMTFSYAITTTPVAVSGMKPTSMLTIDSTKVNPDDLAALEQILYGDTGVDPAMPLPNTVIAMFEEGVTLATPAEPAFNAGTNTITIPTTTGVDYRVEGEIVPAGALVIEANTIVTATPKPGFVFVADVDDDWLYVYDAP
jgi:hypothetical protein